MQINIYFLTRDNVYEIEIDGIVCDYSYTIDDFIFENSYDFKLVASKKSFNNYYRRDNDPIVSFTVKNKLEIFQNIKTLLPEIYV